MIISDSIDFISIGSRWNTIESYSLLSSELGISDNTSCSVRRTSWRATFVVNDASMKLRSPAATSFQTCPRKSWILCKFSKEQKTTNESSMKLSNSSSQTSFACDRPCCEATTLADASTAAFAINSRASSSTFSIRSVSKRLLRSSVEEDLAAFVALGVSRTLTCKERDILNLRAECKCSKQTFNLIALPRSQFNQLAE